MDPYINDILSQPDALRRALGAFPREALQELAGRIYAGAFDRVVITGMGASYNAAYPALLALSGLPVPVQLVDTAELLHYQPGLVGPRTLLWLNSQSGYSAEPVRLLERLRDRRPGFILTCTNDPNSTMAHAADLNVDIAAGPEFTVSAKTYTNMLATLMQCAAVLRGEGLDSLRASLHGAADAMQTYLAGWQAEVSRLDQLTRGIAGMTVLARGPSLSTLWNGTLILKEAAKVAFEGINAAEFRHGPLELVEPGFTALVIAGAGQTRALNVGLGEEILRYGGDVFWLAAQPQAGFTHLPIPPVDEAALPLLEILPFEMLTLAYAPRKGFKAGHFRYIEKVTKKE